MSTPTITLVFKLMTMPTATPTSTSIFASMTTSDCITAGIAVTSLILAVCIPLWRSRSRLKVFGDVYWTEDFGCHILDFVLVNRSSIPIAIAGLDLIEKSGMPANRYSQKLINPFYSGKENKVAEKTTPFPIAIAPYSSQRIIAGFKTQDYLDRKKDSPEQIKTICIHTSRKDKTFTLPYQDIEFKGVLG